MRRWMSDIGIESMMWRSGLKSIALMTVSPMVMDSPGRKTISRMLDPHSGFPFQLRDSPMEAQQAVPVGPPHITATPGQDFGNRGLPDTDLVGDPALRPPERDQGLDHGFPVHRPMISVFRYSCNRHSGHDLYQNSDMTEFGNRLKQARKDAGLTQKQAAARVGMSQSTLSGLETGEQPTSTFLPQLADLYGVSLRWLISGAGSREADTKPLPISTDIEALINNYSRASEGQKELVKVILRGPKTKAPAWSIGLISVIDGIVEAAEKAFPSKTTGRKTA